MGRRTTQFSLSTVPLPANWHAGVKRGFIHALGLAHFAIVHARGWCADSPIARVRLAAEAARLREEVALLREELRIKDQRLARIAPRERPHYAPAARLAILELRAARGWSIDQAAARFLVTAVTLATWGQRAAGPHDLLETPRPVNRFPDAVAHVVQRLRALVPSMGKLRIAQVLARAGLHLGATTVGRMLARAPVPPPPARHPRRPTQTPRPIVVGAPHDLWNVDLTEVPIDGGLAAPWWPFRLPLASTSWWVAVVLDHFSRRVVGFAVFRSRPTAAGVLRALDRAIVRVGRAPRATVTDQGVHFRDEFRRWCSRHAIVPRFGAVGEHGSIAVVERFIRSLKGECLAPVLVPETLGAMRDALARYCRWYDTARPHQGLGGRTPLEVCNGQRGAHRAPRFEPRARYPATSRCAAPPATALARPGAPLALVVTAAEGDDRAQLPLVSLHRAALPQHGPCPRRRSATIAPAAPPRYVDPSRDGSRATGATIHTPPAPVDHVPADHRRTTSRPNPAAVVSAAPATTRWTTTRGKGAIDAMSGTDCSRLQ